jgi:hypothetical protein
MTGARSGLRGEKKSATATLAVVTERSSTNAAAPPANRLILVS